MRAGGWAVAAGILALALAGLTPAAGAGPPEPPPACGHALELAAARAALEAGERERALRHLKRARQILAACEEEAERREPAGSAGEDLPTALAGLACEDVQGAVEAG
jgi:hypothetical protein